VSCKEVLDLRRCPAILVGFEIGSFRLNELEIVESGFGERRSASNLCCAPPRGLGALLFAYVYHELHDLRPNVLVQMQGEDR
jgi:hypothetical protein